MDGGQGIPPYIAVQPDAEEGVHHHIGLQAPGGKLSIIGLEGLQFSSCRRQFRLHGSGILGHLLMAAHQDTSHFKSRLQQLPGAGHAVAAVVARPAKAHYPSNAVPR